MNVVSELVDLGIFSISRPANGANNAAVSTSPVPIAPTLERSGELPLKVEDRPTVLPTPEFSILQSSRPLTKTAVKAEEKPVSVQPPLFWKALAFTLMPFLAPGSGSLSDENKAIFVGAPNQAGIPAGRNYLEEVTNYQTFDKADPVQKLNRPMITLDSQSYYSYVSLYFRSLSEGSDDPTLEKARQDLLKAKDAKDTAWAKAREKYAQGQIDGSTKNITEVEYLNADKDYESTWHVEDACEKKYKALLPPRMEDIARQIDTIKSADDRLVYKKFNNMPCVAATKDFIMPLETPKVDPKDILYQPLYTLPGYGLICNTWQALNFDEGKREGPYDIDLGSALSQPWSDLGHTQLDDMPMMAADKEGNDKVKASITFIGEPAAVEVNRGLWDVNDIRGFEPLSMNTPKFLRSPFCKTTKLLLAWGVEIQVELPQSIDQKSASKVNLSAFRLPLKKLSADGKTLMFSAGQRTWPLLLGLLVDVV